MPHWKRREEKEMATKRLYRSRHADLLGVCHGIAEWKNLPAGGVQLAFILISVCTAVLPCLAIYLIAALVLPVNPYEDDEYEQMNSDRRRKGKESRYSSSSTSDEDLNERFERLKKKVYDTEARVEDTERQWDDKFYNSTK